MVLDDCKSRVDLWQISHFSSVPRQSDDDHRANSLVWALLCLFEDLSDQFSLSSLDIEAQKLDYPPRAESHVHLASLPNIRSFPKLSRVPVE